MNYDMKRSGECIRQLRIQNGLTQEKVAELLNIDRSFYSRIETGKKGCSVDLLVQLSELYQVSLDYLVLGRYLSAMQERWDTAQLEKNISELKSHLERFKESLCGMCPAGTKVSNTL